MTVAGCTHLEQAPRADPPPEAGCVDCLSTGSTWVHLRLCLGCGQVRCCDSSPRRHATAHYVDSRHPVVQSAEPGESWRWCYLDQVIG